MTLSTYTGASIGLLVGSCCGILLLLTPVGRVRRVTLFLQRARVLLPSDPHGRPLASAEVYRALDRMAVRPFQALLASLALISAGRALVAVGPALSTSTALSVVVASATGGAAVVPVLMLRPIFAPMPGGAVSTDNEEAGRSTRRSAAEDFLAPFQRVAGWFPGAIMIAIAVTTILAAAGPSYDAGPIWWEAMVGSTVAVVVALILVERALCRIDDPLSPTDPGLVRVMDVLRSTSLRVAIATCGITGMELCQSAAAVAQGVAVRRPATALVSQLAGGADVLRIALLIAVLTLLLPQRDRMTTRLWPDLPDRAWVPWTMSAADPGPPGHSGI